MPTVHKFVGNYSFKADVVGKRQRKEKRVDMFAATEYSIACVKSEEVRTDAVVAETGQVTGSRTVSMHSWGGKLWIPADDVDLMRVEDYAARLSGWEPETTLNRMQNEAYQDLRNDPILSAFGVEDQALFAEGGRVSEAHFDGKIIRADRTRGHARHMEAMDHVLSIDGFVHFSSFDPIWICDSGNGREGDAIRLVLPYCMPNTPFAAREASEAFSVGEDGFRLDRHADALAWARTKHPGREFRTEGRIVSMDPSALIRNDVSAVLRDAVDSLTTEARRLIDELSPDGVAAWKTLQQATRSIGSRDVNLPADEEAVVSAIRTIDRELATAFLPRRVQEEAWLFRKFAGETLRRIGFEATRKPAFDASDDHDIDAFGTMQPAGMS